MPNTSGSQIHPTETDRPKTTTAVGEPDSISASTAREPRVGYSYS